MITNRISFPKGIGNNKKTKHEVRESKAGSNLSENKQQQTSCLHLNLSISNLHYHATA